MTLPININALGQVIDSTWGRSSTPVTATTSIKMTLSGADRMIVSYISTVNFISEVEMIRTKMACIEESQKLIKLALQNTQKAYKEITGSSISLKEVSSSDSLEIIGFNVHNPKRTAYYRRKTIVEIA